MLYTQVAKDVHLSPIPGSKRKVNEHNPASHMVGSQCQLDPCVAGWTGLRPSPTNISSCQSNELKLG